MHTKWHTIQREIKYIKNIKPNCTPFKVKSNNTFKVKKPCTKWHTIQRKIKYYNAAHQIVHHSKRILILENRTPNDTLFKNNSNITNSTSNGTQFKEKSNNNSSITTQHTNWYIKEKHTKVHTIKSKIRQYLNHYRTGH